VSRLNSSAGVDEIQLTRELPHSVRASSGARVESQRRLSSAHSVVSTCVPGREIVTRLEYTLRWFRQQLPAERIMDASILRQLSRQPACFSLDRHHYQSLNRQLQLAADYAARASLRSRDLHWGSRFHLRMARAQLRAISQAKPCAVDSCICGTTSDDDLPCCCQQRILLVPRSTPRVCSEV
jgi:hypothetical protein